MQINTFELIVGLAGLISLAFNIFQLHRDKIKRQQLNEQRLLHETTLLSIWHTLTRAAKSLNELEHKGSDASTIANNMSAVIDSQTIAIGQFLQKYFGREPSSDPSSSDIPEHLRKLVSTVSNTEIINGEEPITQAMVSAVENADRYIFVVGGRSRNERYLNAIKNRVSRGDILYKRVLTGDHIRHPLCRHIEDTFEKIDLGYLKDDKYGGILATHNTVVFALLSSRVSVLDKATIIRDESIASDFRLYIQDLLTNSTRPVEMSFVKSLCTTCRN